MKTGVICYLKSEREDFDFEQIKKHLKKVFPDAHAIDVVSGIDSEDDIVQAWWHMTTKGVKRILLRFVEIGRNMEVRFVGKEMRLCG